MYSEVQIVGICGGSASGKSTLAQALKQAWGANSTQILSMDRYYIDRRGADGLGTNFDEPACFDLERMVRDLQQIKQGSPVSVPVYNFTTHERMPMEDLMEAVPHVIVEGLFLFTQPALNALLNYRIYVDTPAATRLVRRINRDVKERGRSVTSVVVQYLNTVALMHREHVLPNRELAGCVVSGSAPLDQALRHIAQSVGIKIT